MTCENCGKEFKLIDSIDEGYMDWCDCKNCIECNTLTQGICNGNPVCKDCFDEKYI